MKTTNFLMLVVAIVLIAFFAIALKKGKKTDSFNARAKKPLTENEQPMYFRLVETFPELVVLAQVSFSALMIGRTQADRNKLNRKMADFVICSKAFEVIAVIELDDSSHKGRDKEDATRDAMIASVGYRTIRFKRTPNADELKIAVFPPVPAVKKTTNK